MSERTSEEVLAVVKALKDHVAEIEASVPITRGHYGTYMGLLSVLSANATQAHVMAKVLISAGANKQGVNDALRASYPC